MFKCSLALSGCLSEQCVSGPTMSSLSSLSTPPMKDSALIRNPWAPIRPRHNLDDRGEKSEALGSIALDKYGPQNKQKRSIQSSDPGPAPSTFHPFSYDPVSEKFSDEAVEFPSMSCGDLVRSRRKRYQTGWRGSGGVAQERRAFPESSRSPVRPPASKQRNWSWSYDCAPTLNCFFFHIFLFFFLNHLICGFFFF